MNKIIAIVASVFALNAFAAETPKADAKPAPIKVEKKAEVKPTKSQAKAPAKAATK